MSDIKELVVISGKGGTGKTTVSASLAALADHSVLADCDVDASNLELLLDARLRLREAFTGGVCAEIDESNCVNCGACSRACRFEAILTTKSPDGRKVKKTVNASSCEGCGVCAFVCPQHTIKMQPIDCGEVFVSDTRFGPLVHARLKPGMGNSGKLTTLVREKARQLNTENRLMIIDGPPGIGCPAIASITGATRVLAVTEPTPSGEHDLMRVVELCQHFRIPLDVCINKADLNLEMTERMEIDFARLGTTLVGRIPYDSRVLESNRSGVPVVLQNSPISNAIKAIWKKVSTHLR